MPGRLLMRLGCAATLAAAFALPAPAAQAAFPGANGRIAFDSGGMVYTINADGSGRTALVRGYSPKWSPDGVHIVFAQLHNGQWSIWTMDAGGANQRRIVAGFEASWSPDGDQLVFSALNRAGRPVLYVSNADGTNRRAITSETSNPPGEDTFPSWSPIGRRIAYIRGISDDQALSLVNADGTAPARLTAATGWPDWAPDGVRLVVRNSCSEGCTQQGLYLVDPLAPPSSDARFLGIRGQNPAWSPDGRIIAYRNPSGALALLQLSGRSVSIIRDPKGTPVTGDDPSWQPLVFTTKADCTNGRWRRFGRFKSERDCIKFVLAASKQPLAASTNVSGKATAKNVTSATGRTQPTHKRKRRHTPPSVTIADTRRP
jgi:dipeptidyl aminopeptidase/acylaminoacyl peptidase